MRRIWPEPSGDLDEDALLHAYESEADRLVRVNMVTSLDGAADVDGKSIGLSGREDRQLLTLLRVLAGALVVGAGTLRQENYHPLVLEDRFREWRREHGLAPDPRLVIVSAQLDLDPSLRALAGAPTPPLIITHGRAPADRRAALDRVAETVALGEAQVDLPLMVTTLQDMGYRHILCEGGPHLLGSLAGADLIDELCLTTTPVLAGPGSGRITAGERRAAKGRFRLDQLLAGAEGDLFARYKYCNESR